MEPSATLWIDLDAANQFRWRVVARNGEITHASGVGFDHVDDCKASIWFLRQCLRHVESEPIAASKMLSFPIGPSPWANLALELDDDEADERRWTLLLEFNDNTKTLAWAHEGFADRRGARDNFLLLLATLTATPMGAINVTDAAYAHAREQEEARQAAEA